MFVGLSGVFVALCQGQTECRFYYLAGRGLFPVDLWPLLSGALLPLYSILVCLLLSLKVWHLTGYGWRRVGLGMLALASVGCLAVPSKCADPVQRFLKGAADEIQSKNSLPTIMSVAAAAKKAKLTTDSYFIRDINIHTQAANIWGRQHPDVLCGTSSVGETVVNIVYGSHRGNWSIRVGARPESENESWLLQISTNVFLRWLP